MSAMRRTAARRRWRYRLLAGCSPSPNSTSTVHPSAAKRPCISSRALCSASSRTARSRADAASCCRASWKIVSRSAGWNGFGIGISIGVVGVCGETPGGARACGAGGGRDKRATTGLAGGLVGAAPVVTARVETDSGPRPDRRARRATPRPRDPVNRRGAWALQILGRLLLLSCRLFFLGATTCASRRMVSSRTLPFFHAHPCAGVRDQRFSERSRPTPEQGGAWVMGSHSPPSAPRAPAPPARSPA